MTIPNFDHHNTEFGSYADVVKKLMSAEADIARMRETNKALSTDLALAQEQVDAFKSAGYRIVRFDGVSHVVNVKTPEWKPDYPIACKSLGKSTEETIADKILNYMSEVPYLPFEKRKPRVVEIITQAVGNDLSWADAAEEFLDEISAFDLASLDKAWHRMSTVMGKARELIANRMPQS